MKKLIYISLLFILNSSFLIHNCLCQWVQVSNGMGNGKYVASLAAIGNNIFAGCYYQGVWYSTNNGQNWTQTTLNNQNVVSLVIKENNIFAGTLNNGVYISTNNGQTWKQTSLNNTSVRALVISGNYIFAGCYYPYGVYLSTNNGQNWMQTSLSNQEILSLAISGNNPENSGQVIFAGTINNIVFFSSNNGQNWSQSVLNSNWIYNITINGYNIFAGTGSGIYLSTNNGQNWSLTGFFTHAVYSLTENGNSIFTGIGHEGVWYSTNNGQNWIQKNEGFSPIPSVRALLITNDYIFAGTSDISVWRRPLSDFTFIKNISTEIPSAFSLEQNYPNPFNSMTNFKFQIPTVGHPDLSGQTVTIKVFDISGKEVTTLVNEKLQPGVYSVRFDSGTLPSGIYFYRMQIADPLRRTEKFSSTKKLILLK